MCPSTSIYTKVSAVRIALLPKKTSTFSEKDLRKTLSQYVMTISPTDYQCKCKNFSFTNNTHRGVLQR